MWMKIQISYGIGTTITLPRYDSMFVPANAKEITLQKVHTVLLRSTS